MMPPKLDKLAANYLAGPLSKSISNSIKKGCFPKMQRLPQSLPQIKKRWQKLRVKYSPNKYFKLFHKCLREHVKNTTCGKYEQSMFPFYHYVQRNRITRSMYLLDLLKNREKPQTIITLLGQLLWTFWGPSILSPLISQQRNQLLMDLTKICYATFTHTLKVENSVSV